LLPLLDVPMYNNFAAKIAVSSAAEITRIILDIGASHSSLRGFGDWVVSPADGAVHAT
jgi:hypothetical protein